MAVHIDPPQKVAAKKKKLAGVSARRRKGEREEAAMQHAFDSTIMEVPLPRVPLELSYQASYPDDDPLGTSVDVRCVTTRWSRERSSPSLTIAVRRSCTSCGWMLSTRARTAPCKTHKGVVRQTDGE